MSRRIRLYAIVILGGILLLALLAGLAVQRIQAPGQPGTPDAPAITLSAPGN